MRKISNFPKCLFAKNGRLPIWSLYSLVFMHSLLFIFCLLYQIIILTIPDHGYIRVRDYLIRFYIVV